LGKKQAFQNPCRTKQRVHLRIILSIKGGMLTTMLMVSADWLEMVEIFG